MLINGFSIASSFVDVCIACKFYCNSVYWAAYEAGVLGQYWNTAAAIMFILDIKDGWGGCNKDIHDCSVKEH